MPGLAGRRQPYVLIVEDDPELMRSLIQALHGECALTTAEDAPAAFARLADRDFDLVLLDLIMPRGTGLEILAHIQTLPQPPRVVVMSALARQVDLKPFRPVVAAHLTKPFGLKLLRQAVTDALQGLEAVSTEQQSVTASLLVVDDDQKLQAALCAVLGQQGYQVRGVDTPEEALRLFETEAFDLVVTDWIMPGMTGIDLLNRCKQLRPRVPVFLMTAFGNPDFCRGALDAGASDVLLKPFAPLSLLSAVEKGLQQATSPVARGRGAGRRAEAGGATRYSEVDIVGDSPAMRTCRKSLLQAARLDSPVLIQGETGTGKELFAQALHQMSYRAKGPFVAVNAAALPESLLESELFGYAPGAFTGARKEGQQGKFAQADGGTLFLDEIGDLSPILQAKLLRVLQEGEVEVIGGGTRRVDVRIVAATHRDLEAMAAKALFRLDLFYRLNVVTLELPPLRERVGDVAQLAERFLAELRTRYDRPAVRFSPEAVDLMLAHAWPGNVRELRNAVERAFAFCPDNQIQPEHLPCRAAAPSGKSPAFGTEQPLDLEEQEKQAILRALEAAGGNKVQAARLLGISRAGLYIKLKVYGIK